MINFIFSYFNRIKSESKSGFFRNIIVVAGGAAGAQIVTMACAPIVTRLYGPEAFGVLGSFTAILTVVTPMAALTYPIAIVLPKRDSEARGLAKLSLFLALAISVIAMALLLLIGKWMSDKLGMQDVQEYLYFIPIAMFFSACQQIMESWLIRLKCFGLTARVALLQSIVLNFSKVGFGFYLPFSVVLVVLQSLSHALYAVMLYLGARLQVAQKVSAGSKEGIRKVAYEYREFAIFRAPEVTINSISQSLPVLLLAAFFGPAAAGFYALGRTVLGIPTALIGKSVGDVLYPRLSEVANNEGRVYPLVYRATVFLAVTGSVPFLLVMLCGPWLFSFVFGNEWWSAGEYARWLAPWLFLGLINSPSIKVIPVLGAQGFQLFFTCIMLVVRCFVLFVGYYFFDSDFLAVALFGISGAAMNLILIIIVLNKCKGFDLERAAAKTECNT